MGKVMLLLLVGLGILCSVSSLPMNAFNFKAWFAGRCYNSTVVNGIERLYINGQEHPLGNTLDNFISLIEKIEVANPEMDLKQELNFLISNFTIFNLVYRDDFGQVAPNLYQTPRVNKLWKFDPEPSLQNIVVPLDDSEMCSLFFMLSHTINDTAAWFEPAEKLYSVSNSEGSVRQNAINTHTPREQGVVSVRGSSETVAIARVLSGLYLGLQNTQKKKLSEEISKDEMDELKQQQPSIAEKDPEVEPLFLLTIVDPLALSMLEMEPTKRSLFPNGRWLYYKNSETAYNYSVPELCPTVYELPEAEHSYSSFSSMRGGIDGYILGRLVSQENQKPLFQTKRLSEILRQYYSYKGIEDRTSSKLASFCQRSDYYELIERELKNHTAAFLAAVLSDYSAFTRADNIYREFTEKFGDIVKSDSAVQEYCKAGATASERMSCETPVDVVIVADTRSEEYFKKQQMIIGYLANIIDLWHCGSSATVLVNHQVPESEYQQLVPETMSKACLACLITQLDRGQVTPINYGEVVQTVHRYLDSKKKAQSQLNGAPGKVVIFFDYEEEETNVNGLESALTNLYKAHRDATFLAVGRNEKVLERLTRRQNVNMFVTSVDDEKQTATKLANKVCAGPGALQYATCKQGTNEATAVYEGLVSTNAVEYWAFDPQYFDSSKDVKITVRGTGPGQIQVCHSRTKPEEITTPDCPVLPPGAEKPFQIASPCQGLDKYTCSPLWFAVYGLENKTGSFQPEYCKDMTEGSNRADGSLYCKTLDQTGFRISHEGMRCSGCSALLPVPLLLTLAWIMRYIFSSGH